MSFVFSADGHIVEPADLFTANLPKSLAFHAIRSEVRDDFRCTVSGDKIIHRMRMRPNMADMEATATRKLAPGEQPARKALGHNNIEGRLTDMRAEGIDAEIVFPSLALWTYHIEDPEAELATCQIYNDWHDGFFRSHQEVFVRCGVLPVRDLGNTALELKRLAGLGFTTAMLPVVMPAGAPTYNNEAWDPVFALGAALGIVFVLHTGTGQEDVVVPRGAGGAVMNYTRQMNDGADAIMMLVAGGMLDRMPSEMIRDQVACSFQYDRACIMARSVVGHQAFLWGSDYPHAEGTFPNTPFVLSKLFDGIEISEGEKADIVGLNAARLFGLKRAGVDAVAA